MLGRAIACAMLLLLAGGCGGPGRVEYVGGHCLIDGANATVAEVAARQAQVSERILARQPWFGVVTLMVLVIAGAGYIDKLRAIFSARREGAQALGERLRQALERYRAHPVRYFSIVGLTFGLLVFAGGTYVYLDVDKRASERALGMLQFCQLALRSADEQGVLDEQKRNLESIQSTAGDIRALVDKLPPEQRGEAQQIVEQMNVALGKQSKLVGSYLKSTEDATREARAHAATVERGLSSVEEGVLGLKSLPSGLQNLTDQVHKLDGRLGTIDGRLGSSDGKLAAADAHLQATDTRLQAIEAELKALATRAPASCVCGGAGEAKAKSESAAPSAKPPAPAAAPAPISTAAQQNSTAAH